ncbi:hypothetical protein J6590_002515 [Homalodisca vitripennis]|nr:hypothetical protein J6590_002515 [Homalodisca vitripennis]
MVTYSWSRRDMENVTSGRYVWRRQNFVTLGSVLPNHLQGRSVLSWPAITLSVLLSSLQLESVVTW